jgi:hypothetical protein
VQIHAFLLVAAVAPAHSTTTVPDPVESFRCTSSNPVALADFGALQAAYVKRSAAIITASLTANRPFLDAAVAPSARPIHFFYDAGVLSPTGPAGVSELIRSIAPNSYEVVQERGLPLPPVDPCGVRDVILSLRGAKPNESYVARLKYQRGLLTDMVVQDADFFAGELPVILAR